MKIRTIASAALVAGTVLLASAPAGAGHLPATTTIGLNGQQEVGHAGDPNGSGKMELTFLKDGETYKVCSELTTRNIDAPTAAHIHEAAKKQSGPVVVALVIDGCAETTLEQIDEILDAPKDYYVNVHNAAYPGGAVRGQMHSFT